LVAKSVLVEIILSLVGISRTVVVYVGHAIAIEVVVDAVHGAILVGVHEALVNVIVAVIVLAIAKFAGIRIDLSIGGVTIEAVPYPVIVVIIVHTVPPAISIRVHETLVHEVVAVVVLAVTDFFRFGIDFVIQRSAIGAVGNLVVVVVGITAITEIVKVVVLLFGVENPWAIVHTIGQAIAVLIVFHAIGNAIFIGVSEPLVNLPIAVIIFAIAGFGGRFVTLANQVPIDAQGEAGTIAKLVLHEALLPGQLLVNCSVAVVVNSVAHLFNGNHGIAIRQTSR